MEMPEQRTVVKLSNGLIVFLTKELKLIGADRGDKVWISRFDKIITITPEWILLMKPFFVDGDSWADFVATVFKKYKTVSTDVLVKEWVNVLKDKKARKKLEESLKKFVETVMDDREIAYRFAKILLEEFRETMEKPIRDVLKKYIKNWEDKLIIRIK